MANFYTDNPNIKFYLTHPLIKHIVELKERNFADKDKYALDELTRTGLAYKLQQIVDYIGKYRNVDYINEFKCAENTEESVSYIMK